MSRKKTQENSGKSQVSKGNVSKNESILNIPYNESEIEQKIGKYFWLIIPILTVLYYSYRKIAVGFYQDDEVAQYINMLQFWVDPAAILGNGPKPGYKIFMVLPALISYDAVLIFNSIIAATTVYLTYILLKVYKVNYALVGALLLASQPMFVGLSFRSYSEIFTALCLVSFLILFKKEKFLLSGLLLGYIFSIRQEIALLIIIIGIIFVRRKLYIPAAALLVFPVIYNLLGFIKTGDIMFVLTEMRSVAGLNYKSQGLMHYFKVYIYIVGPVSLSLFLLGFFGFLNDTRKIKEYFQKYFLFYVIFLSVFVIQMLTMLNDGPNPGNWRYLLHISPVCAFFAVIGLNNLTLQRFKNTNFLISGIFLVLVLLFLSYTTDGFRLLEQSNYTAALYVAFFIGITAALGASPKSAVNLSMALVILAATYLYFVEPKPLSPENITVKETAEFLDSLPDMKDKQKLTNHTFIMFHSNLYKQNIPSFKKLDMKNLNEAPKGTVVIWESHYGYRPEFKNDVPFETLQDSAKYKLVKQMVSSDKRFASFIFEKQ